MIANPPFHTSFHIILWKDNFPKAIYYQYLCATKVERVENESWSLLQAQTWNILKTAKD